MPASLVTRVNLDLLYLPFLEVVLNVLAACRARGVDYHATSGTRFWEAQKALHDRYLARKGGRAAAPGHSGHQFGIAMDFVCDGSAQPGVQPRWDEPAYKILGEELQKAGLHWGNTYNDSVHAGWPGYWTGRQLAPLRKVWAETPGSRLVRMSAVWQYLDQHPEVKHV